MREETQELMFYIKINPEIRRQEVLGDYILICLFIIFTYR